MRYKKSDIEKPVDIKKSNIEKPVAVKKKLDSFGLKYKCSSEQL